MQIVMVLLNNYLPDIRAHKEAISLVKAGHHVNVYALWKPGLPETEERDDYRITRIRLITGSWKGKLLAPIVKFMEFWVRFLWSTIRNPADLIVAHDGKTLPFAWSLSLVKRIPTIYDARELEAGQNFGSFRLSKLYRTFWTLPERLFIRKAEAVITVSEGIASELQRIYEIPQPRVVRNCPFLQLLVKTDRLRRELEIPDELKIALYQGGLYENRGIRQLIDAIQSIPDICAVFLGDGPMLPYLREQAQSGKYQRVYLPGWVPVDELPLYTASADIGVVLLEDNCLSHHLALPNKLFEYIQAGIPIVASDLPEIRRVIQEHLLGVVVDQEDLESIRHGIQLLVNDREYYRAVSESARQAAQLYNWDNEAKIFLETVQQAGNCR